MCNSVQVECLCIRFEGGFNLVYPLPKEFGIRSTNSSPFNFPPTWRRIPLNKAFKE